ncbi:bifunctional salicylyl-CoA 5-hydroxylase/oxidoreductase [Sandaracinus amylolyticus]|uniref:bifunctional salicylyl-CoA 5-hydroxylase/oxidoreductase n=1 Tax=Sandaracinus amylolyticus TaxID=927083 RepID=UPI001F02C7C8|nr:bifunctional salicylyl-CoA 5-hydroxylase/oxidoreductase [Sandaracinus amylolyticus]UJR79262.1 Anthraniloyl-CoA monooxygenase [Sandaracinus amylolyticus]
MRVRILGGGPAGLYLAILLKKHDASHHVEVIERNAPDDTFGWGVVFSDETLSNIEEADPETYASFARDFARWDALDIRVKGETIRSHGHGFVGIARKRLLMRLQERARALGVELRFSTEVTDVDALRRDCDLLVGADGLRSLVRKRWEHAFRPTFDVRKARYVWLGSTQRFPAFTFSFRENEHGLFQIHAYQFDGEHSTVIVETDEESWRRAGLEGASEQQTIAYCERVFAEDLGGHPLLPNRSQWIQFTTVKNERWVHENVAILGDAAHTAHFSIGSGTKMAMEDAIVLARAIAAHPGDLSRALSSYEDEQRPTVGRIQTAAQQSLEWFEQAKRHHAALEPMQLAFSLLTRSRRITHSNLAMRDPAWVAEADRWFARRAGVGDGTPPPMFTPLTLRGLTLPNRIVVSPMCQYSAEDGLPDDWHLVHLGSRAIGGAGLVMTEMTDVSPEGRITPGCAGIWSDEHVARWKRVVDFVHRFSAAKIGLQLAHAGRKGSTKLLWLGEDEPLDDGNWELIAPSPVPYDDTKSQTPRPMTRADMDAVIEAHVRGAKNAHAAGFDLLELHMAHGYLLSSFLSPLSNQRTDAYGGSLENRMRFPLEVFDAVRAAWPSDKPMSVRISATDWVPDAFDGDDAVALSRVLKERGCDVIDVSTGQTSTLAKPVYGRAYQTPFSDRIRNELGIPTIAVGNIQDFDQVNSILLAGRADLCALARPHLYDPYFTLHAAAAQGYEGVRWPDQYRTAKTAIPKNVKPA